MIRRICMGHRLIIGVVGAMIGGVAGLVLSGMAQAQDYPSGSVKIVVPFPAGGTADAMPRIIADWLSRKKKEPLP